MAAVAAAEATAPTTTRMTREFKPNNNRVRAGYESVKAVARGPISTLWLVNKREDHRSGCEDSGQEDGRDGMDGERKKGFFLAEYDLGTFSQRAKEVAFDEAKRLRTLVHPNTPRCVDMFYEVKASKICLVYERPLCVSLAAYLAELRQQRFVRRHGGEFSQVPGAQSLSLSQTLHIFAQVCLGIKAFHDCDALHGNLTLSNVFVEAKTGRSPFGDAPLVKVGTPDLCGKFSSFETIVATAASPMDVPGLASPERQVSELASGMQCCSII